MRTHTPLPDLIARLARAWAAGRSFAFHCVTHVEPFALSALQAVASDRRIGSNMLHWCAMRLCRYYATAVYRGHTAWLWQRGERYPQTLSGDEIDHLYRHASIAAAGINVAATPPTGR